MDKQPPANIEAEMAILGSILFDSEAIAKVKDYLPVQAFFVPAHQKIYQGCIKLEETDKGTDFITVVDWFQSRQLLDDIGGHTYLSKLLNQTVSSLNLDRYAKLVLEKYRRRQIIALGHEIIELGYNPNEDLSGVYEQIRKLLPPGVIQTTPLRLAPTVTDIEYSCGNPDNAAQSIKVKAKVENCPIFEDAIADLKDRTDVIASHLWSKPKKNHPSAQKDD